MKIGKPLADLPSGIAVRGRHAAIWAAVHDAAGAWVPIECASKDEARRMQVNASTRRSMPLEAIVRGAVIYIRTKNGHTP